MHNCYVFSLTVRTSASSCSSLRTRRRALTHVRFLHMIIPASGSLCWAWLSGRSITLTMGGSGAVALKAASTAVARLRAFNSRSTLSVHQLKMLLQIADVWGTSRKGNGAGSGGDQGPASGQVIEDGPLLLVLKAMYNPQVLRNEREDFAANWTLSIHLGFCHL